jgi:hypothetical protein
MISELFNSDKDIIDCLKNNFDSSRVIDNRQKGVKLRVRKKSVWFKIKTGAR